MKSLEESSIIRKDFFVAIILLFNAFTWFYSTLIIIDRALADLSITHSQNLAIWAAYCLATVGSSIMGSTLSNKISRLNFLYLWIISGAVTSSLLAPLNSFTVIHVLIVCVLLGVSFGLGMPSCLAYFAGCTYVENRGLTSGIIFLTTNLSAPLFTIFFSVSNLIAGSIILAVWRGFGLIIFLFKPEEKVASKKEKNISFASIVHNKFFILYFIAWLMFCLIDRFEKPILTNFFGDFYYLMVGPIIGSFFALVAGMLSDRIGRKRVILCGFVALGIAYAVIGIAPTTIVSWYFFLTVESIATGVLWVTFVLILWADLSQSGSREKYYAIGASPYFLTFVIQLLSTPYVVLIPAYAAFSVASFFLFVAVFPLMYAPETLSEKKIELRRLKKYVEKAKRVKEKYVTGEDKS